MKSLIVSVITKKTDENCLEMYENESESLVEKEERIRKLLKGQIKEKDQLIIEKELLEEVKINNNMVPRILFDQIERSLEFARRETEILTEMNDTLYKTIRNLEKELDLKRKLYYNEKRRRKSVEHQLEQLKEKLKTKNRELTEMKTRRRE